MLVQLRPEEMKDYNQILVLFPFFPNLRTVPDSYLFSVTDDGSTHQGRILKDDIFLYDFVLHVLHIGNILRFGVPIDQIVNPGNAPQNRIKLLAGQTVLDQVDILVLDSAFFKIPLRFFCIEALTLSENLNIQ